VSLQAVNDKLNMTATASFAQAFWLVMDHPSLFWILANSN
jgi:hypothetical protein